MKKNIAGLFILMLSPSFLVLGGSEDARHPGITPVRQNPASPLRLRNRDLRIPDNCRQLHTDLFRDMSVEEQSFFTASIERAHQYGFDLLYPLSRSGADVLYSFFRNFRKENHDAVRKYQELKGKLLDEIAVSFRDNDEEQQKKLRYHAYMVAEHFLNGPHTFSGESAGDLLELLLPFSKFSAQEHPEESLPFISRFPVSEYFYYSGLEYLRPDGSVAGEVDLTVARRKDCKAVAVVQAKLGVNRLRDAEAQNQRFRDFVRDN